MRFLLSSPTLPFLSTPSARRATGSEIVFTTDNDISIHALREEGDTAGLKSCSTMWKFLSTPSARRATRARARGYKSGVFLSTPSARRATTARRRSSTDWRLFLSTPSARRATRWRDTSRQKRAYFYPRPPRGGRRSSFERLTTYMTISIHALREEGDPGAADRTASADNFYPRPPRGGRPLRQRDGRATDYISIHALREEGDRGGCRCRRSSVDFYPRPPRGGRPCMLRVCSW